MEIDELAVVYRAKSDDELLRLAEDADQLTEQAREILGKELAARGIEGDAAAHPADIKARDIPLPPNVLQAGRFIAEVWRIYLGHFWVFFELSAPAAAVAYLAISIAGRTNWEIVRYLRGHGTVGHQREAFQIWLVALLGYFVSCVASHFAFGAIAAAMAQIETGIVPSPRDVLATVRNHTVPLLRLSLLLFVLILAAVGARQLFVAWFFQVTQGHPYYQSTFVLELLAVGTGGAVLLVMSRFGVAVPTLMLEDCGAVRAMFRSDALTEGRWLILAASVAQLSLLSNLSNFARGWIVHRVATSFPSGSWLPWVVVQFESNPL